MWQRKYRTSAILRRLGYKIEWMPYDEAVSRLKALSEQCKEYQMSFVLKREQLILEKAKEYIVK